MREWASTDWRGKGQFISQWSPAERGGEGEREGGWGGRMRGKGRERERELVTKLTYCSIEVTLI